MHVPFVISQSHVRTIFLITILQIASIGLLQPITPPAIISSLLEVLRTDFVFHTQNFSYLACLLLILFVCFDFGRRYRLRYHLTFQISNLKFLIFRGKRWGEGRGRIEGKMIGIPEGKHEAQRIVIHQSFCLIIISKIDKKLFFPAPQARAQDHLLYSSQIKKLHTFFFFLSRVIMRSTDNFFQKLKIYKNPTFNYRSPHNTRAAPSTPNRPHYPPAFPGLLPKPVKNQNGSRQIRQKLCGL